MRRDDNRKPFAVAHRAARSLFTLLCHPEERSDVGSAVWRTLKTYANELPHPQLFDAFGLTNTNRWFISVSS